METKSKRDNSGKIGILKFWTWSARDLSLSINFIVLSFISIYCTNTLNMEPALVDFC